MKLKDCEAAVGQLRVAKRRGGGTDTVIILGTRWDDTTPQFRRGPREFRHDPSFTGVAVARRQTRHRLDDDGQYESTIVEWEPTVIPPGIILDKTPDEHAAELKAQRDAAHQRRLAEEAAEEARYQRLRRLAAEASGIVGRQVRLSGFSATSTTTVIDTDVLEALINAAQKGRT